MVEIPEISINEKALDELKMPLKAFVYLLYNAPKNKNKTKTAEYQDTKILQLTEKNTVWRPLVSPFVPMSAQTVFT